MAIVIVVLANSYFFVASQNQLAPQNISWASPSAVSVPRQAGSGEHCGGNMTTARTCASGLHCAPSLGSSLPFGDVGGTCVKDSTVEYRNAKYGFFIPLADEWKGYTVLNKTWEGRPIAQGTGNQITAVIHGPLIIIRHPEWKTSAPREDMPIMVFTIAEWNLVVGEKVSLGAAPIPPSKLGENSKYILALPARYNYDFKAGWEEVDQLVHKLTAFEPVP